MRVLSVLSLLCMSMLGVSGQYVTSSTTDGATVWRFTAPATATGPNPTLSLAAGQTYNFSLSATSPGHPFAFSSAENPTNTNVSPIDTTFYTVTQNGCTGDGTSAGGFSGANCIVSLAIAANAPDAAIYYKCTFHSGMTGRINVVAAAANPTTVTPTTAAPTGNGTTATPTTATPTTGGATTATPTGPATGATITGNSFKITGAQTTQAWIFTANGVQYLNPTLNVTAGQDVTISIETNTVISPPHPFAFSNNGSTAAIAPSKDYFPDAVNTWTVNNNMYCDLSTGPARTVAANATNPATNPCVITVKAADVRVGTTFYYRCAFHPNMIGTINVVAAGSSGSSSSSSSTGSGTGGTGGSSSTGKSSASTVAGAGMALMVAFISTLLA